MFKSHLYKALFSLKGVSRASPSSQFYRLLQHHPSSPFFPNYSTIASNQYPFRVSYLISNCGFSPETALKASKLVHFQTPQKPDSVLAFFRNHGFSDSQINGIVRKAPKVLSFDPNKTLLPKFEFLASKGASSSDIVLLVTRSPRILYSSLGNNIITKYELVRRFLQSDKKTIRCLVNCPSFFVNDRVAQNVKYLLDDGVAASNVIRLFRTRPSIFLSNDLRKVISQVKELGFDPLKSTFSIAMVAKGAMAKPRWDAKVEAFKSWGWSAETILEAFRRNPYCMLTSNDKINAVMRFWVNQLGWNSSHLVKGLSIFGFSLEKRIIPRAFVVQYLLAKGLRKKNASLITPFYVSEESFLLKFVKCFKEEETSQILKLYQLKMNL